MTIKFMPAILGMMIVISSPHSVTAQNGNNNEQAEMQRLKTEVENLRQDMQRQNSELRNEIKDYTPIGLVLFLFGGFCALWAQNTGRNPWSWFFLGLLFSLFAVITDLIRNAEDNNSNR